LDKGLPVPGTWPLAPKANPAHTKHNKSSFLTSRNGLLISVETRDLLPEAIVFQ